MTSNDLTVLTSRTEVLINALTDAILSSAEVAAERIQLASQVAAVTQRMGAFSAVLEIIAATKEPLLKEMEGATGAKKLLLKRQIDMLGEQEIAVLEKASVPNARMIVAKVDRRRIGGDNRLTGVGDLNGSVVGEDQI